MILEGDGFLALVFHITTSMNVLSANVQEVMLIPPNMQVEERIAGNPAVRAEVSGVRFPI